MVAFLIYLIPVFRSPKLAHTHTRARARATTACSNIPRALLGNATTRWRVGEICVFVRSEQKQKEEMNKRNKDGLTTQAKPSVAEMILNKRLGRLVATMGPGSGFGELALLEKRAGANKRSASCICPLDSATQGATAEPCHLLTLERSVYIRLSKIGDKSD